MSLGLVANNRRVIKSGNEYNRFFGQPKSTDRILGYGNTFRTIDLMRELVADTLDQTKKIAPKLRGSNKRQTLKNIWNFCYNHFQYKEDSQDAEQLREPNRSWADRKTGIDCDCFTILISSILTNLGIEHSMRKAAYSKQGNFQHIYVVVPIKNKNLRWQEKII